MTKYGTVISQDSEWTIIDLHDDAGGCQTCGLKKVCKPKGNQSDGEIKLAGSNDPRIPVLRGGQEVRLEIKESRSIGLAFLLFILPLLMMAGAYLLFQALGLTEIKSVLFSLPMVALTLLVLILLEKRLLGGVHIEPCD